MDKRISKRARHRMWIVHRIEELLIMAFVSGMYLICCKALVWAGVA